MSEFPLPADKLKKLVNVSKKQPVNFAFNPGPDKDSHFLAVHRKKNPEMLGKLARKEGQGAKVAFGEMSMDGKLITLKADKLLPRLAKVFKQYLKGNGITKNVQIMDVDGNILDSDVEDLPDEAEDDIDVDLADDDDDDDEDDDSDAQAQDVAPEAPLAPDPAQVTARLRALQPAVLAAPDPIGPKLIAAFKGAVASVQGGDLARAEQAIAQIEAVLAKLAQQPQAAVEGQDAPQQDPRLAKLKQALDAIRAQAEVFPAGVADPISDRLDALGQSIAAGEVEAVTNGLREIQTELKDIAAAKAKWDAAYAKMEPLVTKALSEWPAASAGALRTKWQFAVSLAMEDGLFDRAASGLPAVVQLLRSPPPMAAEDGTPPGGGVAFQTSRVMWLSARNKMMDEVQALVDQIVAQSSDDEDADDIKAASAEIYEDASRIDTRLQNALDAVTTASAESRTQFKRQAAAILTEYQAILGTGIFRHIDENPFKQVSAVATARAALATISRTLA